MEKTRTRRLFPYVVAVIAVALFVALLTAAMPPQGPRMLYPGEVRNYMGEDLSSIADVQENAITGRQFLNNSEYRLRITGLVSNPLELTYDEVLNSRQRYQKVVTLYCVEGWSAKILWEGILMRDLLEAAGANMSASTVIFRASDGYSTALPLSYLVERDILLAYKMNNLTLPMERGFPFELVAETQAGYKWIKWLTLIEVSNNAGYLGYWESRGYPNNATVG